MGGDGEPNTRLECKTCPTSTTESKVKQSAGIFQPGGAVEKRIHDLENKMTLLDSFSETDEILNWARGRERSLSKVSDLWNFMNFQKRIEASEDGIKKVWVTYTCYLKCNIKTRTNIHESFCFKHVRLWKGFGTYNKVPTKEESKTEQQLIRWL